MRETRCQSDANLKRESVAFVKKKGEEMRVTFASLTVALIVSLQIKCVAVCRYVGNSVALWPRLRSRVCGDA